jgi:uncharacterized membrane protein (UPF0182 family)
VAAFLNNRLGYTATLEDSIAQVLGAAPESAGPGGPAATGSRLAQILAQEAEAFRQAQDALDRKDLGAYQRAIDRLGRLIREARQAAQAAAPAPQGR